MHKGYLSGSIIVFIFSFVCIISTFIDVLQLKYTTGSIDLWGSVVFHATTAIIASFLLVKARPVKQMLQKEGEK